MLTHEKITKLQNMILYGTPGEKAAATNLLHQHTRQPPVDTALNERLQETLKRSDAYIESRKHKGFTPLYRAQQYEAAAEKAKRQQEFIRTAYAQMLEQKDAQEYRYSAPRSATTQPPTPAQANAATLFFVIVIILFLAALT